jgi:hypothetical protein
MTPEHVTRDRRYLVLGNGTYLPVTNWVDADGEDCDPEDAVVGVAGSDDHGWWTFYFHICENTLH